MSQNIQLRKGQPACGSLADLIWKSDKQSFDTNLRKQFTHSGRQLRQLTVSIMATLLTKAISVTHSSNAHLSCCESNESSSNGARPSQVGSFMKCLCLMARGVSHGQPVLKTPLCRWAAICSPLLVSCF